MTCVPNSTNRELHSRIRVLRQREEEADKRLNRLEADRATNPDEYRRVDACWNSICDQRLEAEDELMAAPINSTRDIVAKMRIILHRAEGFDVGDLAAMFVEQIGERLRFA